MNSTAVYNSNDLACKEGQFLHARWCFYPRGRICGTDCTRVVLTQYHRAQKCTIELTYRDFALDNALPYKHNRKWHKHNFKAPFTPMRFHLAETRIAN